MCGADQILINIKMRLKFLINQTSEKETAKNKNRLFAAGGFSKMNEVPLSRFFHRGQ